MQSPEGEAKHTRIVNSLGRLEDAVASLEDLARTIEGTKLGQPLKNEPKEPTPPLSHVLDTTPDMISKIAEEIDSIVNNIKEKLF